MRMWMAQDGSLLTDEQLLRHVAHFGSLSKALEGGEVTLVSETPDMPEASDAVACDASMPRQRRDLPVLSDFLS